MRQKRAKQYRRLLQQYQLHFGFRPPFQILVDDAFTLQLAKETSHTSASHDDPQLLLSRLSTILQQPADTRHVKLMITQCCMVALYNLEEKTNEKIKELKRASTYNIEHESGKIALAKRAIALGKTCERRRCNHKEAIAPEECVASVVGPTNKHRYILATARLKLRTGEVGSKVVGLPVIHPNETGVLVMAPMNEATTSRISELEQAALKGPATEPLPENVITGPAPTSSSSTPVSATAPISRKRKAKGPNPLSVKKKKKPNSTAQPPAKKKQKASGGATSTSS
ncbi:hypothetical protein OC861_005295 [Tilletia horrida]|nr:hypothetical protein OC861_005295 [Tilletia horrida]